jgi:hypothetical protein
MKMKYPLMTGLLTLSLLANALAADPRVDSWFIKYSAKYARVYATTADLNSGNAVTTWSRNSLNQSLPAYCGVQELYSSSSWTYLRTTGLGIHVMGPWYLNSAKTMLFPNLPVNQKALYRIPRNPTVPGTKTLTGLGVIGYFVDGVAMFDGRDAFYWNGSSEVQGSGLWNRDAYVNESVTFDPANAHQQNTGTYHYHANPIALRYLLGDQVAFNTATETYSENPSALTHSPILGWVRDGYPVYGPYGYSSAMDTNSPVRKMVSGFVPRNGANGTLNLTNSGRTTLPAWAGRAYNRTTTLAPNEYGPNVSTTYPLGRYLEDNDYLGDLGKIQGIDFDLDEYNGRFCLTPEFPSGTYAYFVSIATNGAPAFPYNIGRAFYGSPVGGSVASLSETVTTNFLGLTTTQSALLPPSVTSSTVTLTWSSIEGGIYQLESSNDLTVWNNKATNVLAQGITTQVTTNQNGAAEFFRVNRTGIASYDSPK